MSDWLSQANYLLMLMQIVVTLVLIPVVSFAKLKNIALDYGLNRYPQSAIYVKQCLSSASKQYWSVVFLTLLLAAAIVIHAIINGIELLNWDNQMGAMIIYLLAMIPVIVMVFMHKRLFNVFKQYAGSKRSASLQVRRWQDYVSKPLLVLIGIANVVYLATVLYFVNHPFDGFAGYHNLLGLLVINAIFLAIIVYLYKGNKNHGYYHPEHREAIKKRAIQINMLILALALLQISLSIWVQGTYLVEYKLWVQSLYLQLILALTAFSLTLPKSIFDNPLVAK